MKSPFTTTFLWGVYPYVCFTLFLLVPIIRMIYRPFGFSTRASSLFNRNVLGVASLPLHWGILTVFVAHLAGFIGGLLAWESWIVFFKWAGLIGGFLTLFGSIVALVRRLAVAEVRAMSQWDDYLVHVFLVALLSLGLYQVLVDRIFGVAYAVSSWLASVSRFAPQPELMLSASLISQWHVFLALTFFALFPFTKLVHFWTFPINYFVRPYQAMRTARYLFQERWEFALRSDKSFLIYSLVAVLIFFGGFSLVLGRAGTNGTASPPVWTASGRLTGPPLYISQCARCHGVTGKGDGLGAHSPTFTTVPRDFTLGKYAFISTDNGLASDADLARTVRRGLVPSGMPAFAELDDHQVASLVAVLRRFAPEPDEPPGAAINVPPVPAQPDLVRGRELYVKACAPCHGTTGHGDGHAAQTIRDWYGRPVRPRDLSGGQLRAGGEAEQIYLRIAAGVPPAMPAYLEAFQPEDIWSMVFYLRQEILPPELARR